MLIDLLSTSNYVSYNIGIANLLGLKMAIYLSEIMNVNDKAIRKRKVDENGFILDREYIQMRTTITIKEQSELDDQLVRLGVLEVKSGALKLDVNKLLGVLISDKKVDIESIKRVVKSIAKPTKKQCAADAMKSNINATNVELISAYSDWIDSVFAKENWMSKKAVLEGQRIVDENSNHNLDVALRIISIATVNGWRDMAWAVERYNREFSIRYSNKQSERENKKIEVGDDVF